VNEEQLKRLKKLLRKAFVKVEQGGRCFYGVKSSYFVGYEPEEGAQFEEVDEIEQEDGEWTMTTSQGMEAHDPMNTYDLTEIELNGISVFKRVNWE
jgi:hypothetical protein